MNRFPHESHSPTTFPSASVLNRRGPPHSRQGRAPGIPGLDRASRGRGRRPVGGGRGFGSPRGARMYVTVVLHEMHRASKLPSEEVRSVRAVPHSAHAGPSDGGGTGPEGVPSDLGGAAGSAGAEVGGGAAKESRGTSCTIVNVPPQPVQLPWSTRAVRSTNSASAPQSGQAVSTVIPEASAHAASLADLLVAPRAGRARGGFHIVRNVGGLRSVVGFDPYPAHPRRATPYNPALPWGGESLATRRWRCHST